MTAAAICDIVLISGTVGMAAYGMWRGALKQLGSVAAFLLAFFAARMGGYSLAGGLHISPILAYMLIFIVVYVAVAIVFHILHFTAKLLLMGPLDRFLGLLCGALKWALAASIVLNIIHLIEPSSQIFHSQITTVYTRFAPWLLGCAAAHI